MAKVFGIDVEDLDDGDMPIDVIVLVKVMDQDGETYVLQKFSSNINPWEALGCLIAATDVVRKSLLGDFEEDDD